jgi:cell shape-determining protein MreC
MKTISRSRKKHSSIGRLGTLAAVFIFIVLISILLFWRSAAGSVAWRILSPVVGARSASLAAGAGFFSQFSSNAALAEENMQLRAALASSTNALADRNVLYQENLDLKARVGRDAGMQTILAAVIMRPPGMPYDTLMIDAGSDQGVAVGDLVSASGTALVGQISAAYADASRVVLFSAPGQTYDGMLRGSIPISVEGQGAGSLDAQVPAGTDAAVGDPVLLSSIAPGFASVVSHVDKESGQSFETLYLQLPVDPLTLSYVEVIKK